MNNKAIIIIIGIIAVILINLFYFLRGRESANDLENPGINILSGGATGYRYQAEPNERFSPLNIVVVDSLNGLLIEGFPFTIKCNDPETIKGASYEWQINGQEIAGENTSSCNYQLNKPGVYTVKVLQKPTMLFDTLSFRVFTSVELLRNIQFDFEIERLGSVYFLHDRTKYPPVKRFTRVLKINDDFFPFNESPKNITKFLVSGANSVAISILDNGKEIRTSGARDIQIGQDNNPSLSQGNQTSSSGSGGSKSQVHSKDTDNDELDDEKAVPNPSRSNSGSTPAKTTSYSFNPIKVCSATGQTEKSSGSIGITPRVGAGKKVELQKINLVSTKSGPVSIKLLSSNGDLIAESRTFLNSGINDVLLFDLYSDLVNNKKYTLRFDSEEEGLKVQIFFFNCFDYDFPDGAELKLDGDHFFSELTYTVK